MSEKYDRNRNRGSDTTVCCKVSGLNSADDGERAAASADAAEEIVETRRRRAAEFCEPICINANQIYDSCRDRDCVSNARVYITASDSEIIDSAINVKLKRAEIIWVYTNIEPLSFNKGYFSVDLKYFIRVTLEVFTGVCNPTVIYGLTTFDKRVILYGSEGNSKVFKSNTNCGSSDMSRSWRDTNMPTVVVEAVEPVALNAKLVEKDCCCTDGDTTAPTLTNCTSCDIFPASICECFDEDLVIDNCRRQIQVSYGLFSIIRLERDTQLLVDAVDFCIPAQECSSSTEENPCELFNDIRFPIDEFFPPQKDTNSGEGHCHCRGKCNCG